MKYFILLPFSLLVSLCCQSAYSQTSEGNTCQYFYEKLRDLPNKKLTRQEGTIIFSWDKTQYPGCKIKFVTNDSLLAESPRLPSFWPQKDTTLYQQGWRYNLKYDAGGPGTSMFGIEKGDTLCLISERQPATLIKSGEIKQSSKLTIEVECRIK